MNYITGIHALNLPCSLDTTGDWHLSALRWSNITIRNSDESIFKDYGIEHYKNIPVYYGIFSVANHIRALLDLLDIGKLVF